jgi:hypothetical protein
MTNRELNRLEKKAYHEAGHGVAGFAMGKRFKKISIIEDEDSDGRVSGSGWHSKLNPELDKGKRTRHFVEREIIFLLAGAVAEAKITGEYNHIGASDDYHKVVKYASWVTDSIEETEAYIAWLFEKTKNVIWPRWDAVELLADELIKRQEIGYMAARGIIRKGLDGDLPPLDLKRALAKKDRGAKITGRTDGVT